MERQVQGPGGETSGKDGGVCWAGGVAWVGCIGVWRSQSEGSIGGVRPKL
jgi:hypothetical protein